MSETGFPHSGAFRTVWTEDMFIDTHAHYDDEKFSEDRDELLSRLFAEYTEIIIDPGCEVSSSRHAAALADRYPGMYFAAGIHPENLDGYGTEMLGEIETLAKHEKCVAIGEIGLDYYWDKSRTELQKEVFDSQLRLALSLDLPVIVHDREAHEDSMKAVLKYPGLRGVFHCFSGSAEMAKELLKRGWYLGFDGPITYKNARKALEVLEICPLDRLLVETDSPYLSPVPMRGKRNDSSNIAYILQTIAGVKSIGVEEAELATGKNARALFTRLK